LANEVGDISLLTALVTADHSGRPFTGELHTPKEMHLIEDRAEALKVRDQRPEQILMGRHLMERGWKPGPMMGAVLRDAFEMQLSDDPPFYDLESALAWLDLQDYKVNDQGD
jgi:tRNA nucleotidyltransferase (CCA-adding enzyme)